MFVSDLSFREICRNGRTFADRGFEHAKHQSSFSAYYVPDEGTGL